VDLVGRTVHIQRALNLDGSEKGTKTNHSRRVDLSRRLCATLAHEHSSLSPLVFASRTGATPGHDAIGKAFRRLLRQAELPNLGGLYALRHTFASHLLAMGAPITYVSNQLGHSSPQITLSVYAHFLATESSGMAERLQDWRATPKSVPRKRHHSDTPGHKSATSFTSSRRAGVMAAYVG